METLARELYDDILARADGDMQTALEIATLLLAQIETERLAAQAAASAGYMRRKAG